MTRTQLIVEKNKRRAEVGAIGAGIDIGKKDFKAKGADAFGASLSVSW